jgi:hypothetical protein
MRFFFFEKKKREAHHFSWPAPIRRITPAGLGEIAD